jgi:hypothetical protein
MRFIARIVGLEAAGFKIEFASRIRNLMDRWPQQPNQ